jgi:6-phosphogluconate dehydrogenase (decarboxylating)
MNWRCLSVVSTKRVDAGKIAFGLQSRKLFSAEGLTAALFARFRSRQEHTFAEKMLSAMRNKIGGHVDIYPVN